jgi:dephospho-CoA kinase
MLAAHGAVVIDADAIARQVVEPGSPVLDALVERFGADVLAPDGNLDRQRLAERAFADDESKAALEAITHPAIGEEFLRQAAAAPPGSIVVHDVPLLAETGRAGGYAAVIVVETSRDERLRRLEARGIRRADAEARMAAQASDGERRAVATWVIVNDGDLATLEGRVQEVWEELLKRTQEPDAR